MISRSFTALAALAVVIFLPCLATAAEKSTAPKEKKVTRPVAPRASDEVKRLQEALKAKGYDPGPIDGVMGPKAREALKAFQEASGFKGTGKLDDKTAEALGLRKVKPVALPGSTQEMLKRLKLDAAIFSDIDKELQVRQSWIDGARKEGKLRVFSTIDPPQADVLFRPFKERYPFIALEYSRASHEDRAVRTLVAFKNKKIVTDILTGVGGSFFMYKEANALEDLRNLPNIKNNPAGTYDPEGLWVGMHMRHWCMGYNTKMVKREDLPRKWEDFLTNPIWRNGNLALGNRPQLWALLLWKANGEKWTKDFLTKLFAEVKPQLRREGMNALLELTAAGEFYANIPAAEYRVHQKVLDGAPVSFMCPEPVPIAVSEMAILKGAPNINGARLFVNWFLSKEGQIAQYVSDFAPPVHKDLRRKEFLPFADQIVGKQSVFRDPAIELELQPKLLEFWDGLWLRGGDKRR